MIKSDLSMSDMLIKLENILKEFYIESEFNNDNVIYIHVSNSENCKSSLASLCVDNNPLEYLSLYENKEMCVIDLCYIWDFVGKLYNIHLWFNNESKQFSAYNNKNQLVWN